MLSPVLAVDANGLMTAAYVQRSLYSSQQILAATRAPGGSWTTALPVSALPDGTDALSPVVAMDVVGQAWSPGGSRLRRGRRTRAGERARHAESAARRAVDPGERDRWVPATFSCVATDAWSPVSSTSWSFGDGTAASGASVSHTYAGAGTYAVSVTVTDAVGNARTRTGSTVVTAAPVVTPPAATPKPKLTGVKLTKKTIHVVKSDDKPRSTKLKLTLNTDAKVKVVLKRTKKVHGKTVKATLTKALKQGAATIKLTSKVGSKQLPPGTYKVKVTGKNAVGTSVAVVVELKIRA